MFTYFVFLPVLAFIVVWGFSVNYGRLRDEGWFASLEPDEEARDSVEVRGLLSNTRMVLTDRRLIEQRLAWPFVRRVQRAVGLADVRAVSWTASVSVGLLLIAGLLYGWLNPLALLLTLYALQTPVSAVRFHTSFLHLPVLRPVIRGTNRAEHARLASFYSHALAAVVRFHAQALPREYRRVPVPAEPKPVYVWSNALWMHLVFLGCIAMLGRFAGGHVVMTDLVSAPLFLGLTAAVALNGTLGDACWAGVLSPLMVLAVKFPASLLTSFVLNDGGANVAECLFVMVGFFLVAMAARWLGMRGKLPLFALAPAVWPLLLVLVDTVGTRDLLLPAQTFLAIGIAVLGAWLYEELGMLLRSVVRPPVVPAMPVLSPVR